ncbi:MAG: glycosyltransferase family 4 protein [Chloroflexia bacterium]|nr:glycosyltransferase family 4 protein [Chloroflexia bacterium]
MKIAYLSTDFGIPVHGNKGASIHVRELSASLARQGHEIEIVTCRAGGDAPAGFAVPVHEFAVERPERLLAGSLQDDPGASESMAKEVRSMLYAANLRYRLLPTLCRMRPDAIYERYSLLGTTGVELARELGIPHILEVNAPLSEEHARHRGSAFPQMIRRTERRILAAADQVIAVSEPLGQWIVESGVDPDRVTVVPNGVDVDRFAAGGGDLRRRLGLDDRPVVGFAGTLKGWHGTETLVRAIGQLARQRGLDRTPHLLIVGDGPQRLNLEGAVAEAGVESLVTFTGTIPHDEMPDYLVAMDIAVAPYDASPDFYFSPLKLFEYMAAARPVIAAGIGQIEDCLRDGVTGLLYPPGDVDALAQRIGALVDNPARRRALGEAAQADVSANRTWSRNAGIVVDLIERERAHLNPEPVLNEGMR